MRLQPAALITAFLTALASAPAAAQECAVPAPGADSAGVPERRPDVLIRATVQARELRFQSDPRASLRVNGCELPASAYVTERTNLPHPVQPGVTYRDVRVGVEIRAWLNVQCLPALAAADPQLCAPVQIQTNISQPPPGPPPAPANPPGR